MYIGKDLDAGTWGESIAHGLNFDRVLPEGEVIEVALPWTCRVADGSIDSDAAPAARVDGSPVIVDGVVSRQRLTFPDGLSTRVKYLLEAEVTTNRGNVLRRFTHLWILPFRLAPDFQVGEPGEDVYHTMILDRDFTIGEEIISSDTWTIAVAADSPNPDPDAASRITGISTHGKAECYQRITLAADMVASVRYLFGARVTTSLGNVIKLHAYKTIRGAA